MGKNKKIGISDFISDKKLSKIEDIIVKSDTVEESYERIEELIEDDYKFLNWGTNRVVFVSKKEKYEDYIIKIAGDSKGVEANYREFYNGDINNYLDKDYLTFSYSISDNGVFVVQERVKSFKTPEDMENNKKKVRKMLEYLEDKILLVDCDYTKFKNFGLRKDGDICILDHGDMVPLFKYQSPNTVSLTEEINVSLRCKKYEDPKRGKFDICDGKLKYSDDYMYLICNRCGAKSTIESAYRPSTGQIMKSDNLNMKNFKDYEDGYDPKEWFKEYCRNSMIEVNAGINNINMEDVKMDTTVNTKATNTKEINGEVCKNLAGYWIPEKVFAQKNMQMLIASIKCNKMKPDEILKRLSLDPDEYKYRLSPTPDMVMLSREQSTSIYTSILKYIQENDDLTKEFIVIDIESLPHSDILMSRTNCVNYMLKRLTTSGYNVKATSSSILIENPNYHQSHYPLQTHKIDVPAKYTPNMIKAELTSCSHNNQETADELKELGEKVIKSIKLDENIIVIENEEVNVLTNGYSCYKEYEIPTKFFDTIWIEADHVYKVHESFKDEFKQWLKRNGINKKLKDFIVQKEKHENLNEELSEEICVDIKPTNKTYNDGDIEIINDELEFDKVSTSDEETGDIVNMFNDVVIMKFEDIVENYGGHMPYDYIIKSLEDNNLMAQSVEAGLISDDIKNVTMFYMAAQTLILEGVIPKFSIELTNEYNPEYNYDDDDHYYILIDKSEETNDVEVKDFDIETINQSLTIIKNEINKIQDILQNVYR